MRIVAHLDMDAFFAAVEERDNPRFKGLPIAVGADPKDGKGRGIISTANYKAREYGLRSALPISTAWRLSEAARREGKPPVVFIEPDFRKYSEVSRKIMDIVREQIPLVEQASVDEAYLDLSFAGSFEAAREIAEKIKKEIRSREQLTCSIGVGPNKLVAKIASDMQKPDGLTMVRGEEAEKFLEPLPIRKIPGVGPKTEEMLRKFDVRKVQDLKRFSENELKSFLGKWGGELYRKVRGVDESPITEEYEAKSIGEQETFETDSFDPSFISAQLKGLSADVFRRFSESSFVSFKTIVVTIRFADFETKNRSHTLPNPSNSKSALEFEAMKLLMPFLDARENPQRKPIRLIGVRVEKLESRAAKSGEQSLLY